MIKLFTRNSWLFAQHIILFAFALYLIAPSILLAADLLAGFSSEERSWVERSCPKSLGPSLYMDCVKRDTAALKSGVPNISHLPSNLQDWIRQSCPMSLGPSLYIDCVKREMIALEETLPDLTSLDPKTRAWIEQSCPRSLGPSLYFDCVNRELRALGIDTSPKNTRIETPSPRSIPSKPKRTISTSAFKWPTWKGQRPTIPPKSSQKELSPADIFRINSISVYVVIAGPSQEAIANHTDDVALGSAVAVSPRHLITNCHIFKNRPVIFIKHEEQIDRARILYAQPDTDRCYLETETLRVIPIRGLRRFGELTIGERVYSIGSPSGLENTLGEGIVSGLRKWKDTQLIQTSAPISPGSSGGGLFCLIPLKMTAKSHSK